MIDNQVVTSAILINESPHDNKDGMIKMQTNNKNPHVILVHGLHQRHWIMKPLAKQLERAGYIPHCFDYYTLKNDINHHTSRLNDWLATQVGTDNFCMVGHSLGGLVIREFIHRYPQWQEHGQLQKIVTLGTPHLGSTTADYAKRFLPFTIGNAYQGALDGTVAPLPNGVCLGVIAGNKPYGLGQAILNYHNYRNVNHHNDNKHQHQQQNQQQYDSHIKGLQKAHDGTVYVSETMLPNATDHLILPVTHTGMLVDKEVARQIVYFLSNGVFER